MPQSQIIDEVGQLLASLLGGSDGMRIGLRERAKSRAGLVAKRLELVTEADLAPLRAMIAAARKQQADIVTRLERLESRSGNAVKSPGKKNRLSTLVNPRRGSKTTPGKRRKTSR